MLRSDKKEDHSPEDCTPYGYPDTSLRDSSDKTKRNEYCGNRCKFIAHILASNASSESLNPLIGNTPLHFKVNSFSESHEQRDNPKGVLLRQLSDHQNQNQEVSG